MKVEFNRPPHPRYISLHYFFFGLLGLIIFLMVLYLSIPHSVDEFKKYLIGFNFFWVF